MFSFECDYAEGAHELILKRLLETNLEQLPGYGEDHYCRSAKEKIKKACDCPGADVWFVAGGTQTNALVVDAMLDRFEGVVAAKTGHVNAHESGAIEYTGHKVLALPEHDGKIDAKELEEYLEEFWQNDTREHMVFPGMVYISYPTEYGTLYGKRELEEIAAVCRKFEIPLYMDGARLGYGLMSPAADLTLQEIAKLCDVFYIGGTKVGALCGEAVVFTKNNTPSHFLARIKQHGALMAKGRLLGIQFDTLFTDGLYFEISRHAIRMAGLLKEGFASRGYEFFLDSPTNQQFIVLDHRQLAWLKEKVVFSIWEKKDDAHTVVRFATSWATREEEIRELMGLLDAYR
ncbi:MAG: low specificity L-threonine aldolase [Lachnospiraceae bacterium]|nr:low specificity L-threonine aldolase [Lachnospiraceae bacterium]